MEIHVHVADTRPVLPLAGGQQEDCQSYDQCERDTIKGYLWQPFYKVKHPSAS